MLDIKVLKQYNSLKTEILELQRMIKETEDSIARLVEEGTVVDKVTGGYGGIQGFKIEGFPVVEYNRRRKILEKRVRRLQNKETSLLELIEQIESEIDNIPDSRDREIMRQFIIEQRRQVDIARKMHLDRSLISKVVKRYFKKNKKK